MFKRLAVIAVSALVAASFGIPAAFAQTDNPSFTLTVNKTANYTNQFKTAITLSGTYTCSPSDPINSGININVSQIQGKGVIVTGGSYLMGPLTCDGVSQPWTVTPVYANFGPGMGGMPATWKGGRATANVQGNASYGDCGAGDCIAASVDQVIHIHH